MKVAIIGTQGVPAQYGGFETLVENIIGERCSSEIEYTVFCSSKDYEEQLSTYKGATLKYIPMCANGIQSTLYDGLSLLKAVRGYDVILVLGISGCIFLPLFRLVNRKKLIINIDGLEWKRAKWGWFAKAFLRLSEEMALRFADIVVADNQGIVDYVRRRYKKKTVFIAYGSDHVVREIPMKRQEEILGHYGLRKNEYSISVCRIESENNCELILNIFARSGKRLVFIGNWDRSEYGRKMKEKYSQYENITILDPIYDLDLLYVLRNNSEAYVHGHSAGGTNPSLVEAMFCGCNVFAYDVVYNRKTTEEAAHYFKDGIDLAILTMGQNLEKDNSEVMRDIAKRRYTWAIIAKQYESLYFNDALEELKLIQAGD